MSESREVTDDDRAQAARWNDHIPMGWSTSEEWRDARLRAEAFWQRRPATTVRRIGTIAGRHSMPVEGYLLEEPIEPGQATYEKVFEAAERLGELLHYDLLGRIDNGELTVEAGRIGVELYYTGLTEATLGAIDGLEMANVDVLLMRYDAASGEYTRLVRKGDGLGL